MKLSDVGYSNSSCKTFFSCAGLDKIFCKFFLSKNLEPSSGNEGSSQHHVVYSRNVSWAASFRHGLGKNFEKAVILQTPIYPATGLLRSLMLRLWRWLLNKPPRWLLMMLKGGRLECTTADEVGGSRAQGEFVEKDHNSLKQIVDRPARFLKRTIPPSPPPPNFARSFHIALISWLLPLVSVSPSITLVIFT